ncbi:MAG: NAD(P)-binding domain-containing protein [Flavobacteriales bacterium]|nr:NAD(P)-binding domain-containing protein [Flavobacteriales bacterium]
MKISIIGSGAMGSGIAQVLAQSGHEVLLTDTRQEALDKAKSGLQSTMTKLVEKAKLTQEIADAILQRISFDTQVSAMSGSALIIEAIVENIEIKKKVFAEVEEVVDANCILASNTSSLSITSIASACKRPERVLGIHFFNPAPLMPLVEIIPALQTSKEITDQVYGWVKSWGKVPVICKDTPGFIVNRVARPFYGEAIRIYEEGFADFSTIDQSMRDLGFKMGPFELMDMIGNDVNFAVTESVFAAFFYDQRFKPSLTQKKLNEAGWLGRKTGRGYYSYADQATIPPPQDNASLKQRIGMRILVMLINEAYDTFYLRIASAEDIDLAMTKGVNYPKGLIAWGKELGLKSCVDLLDELYHEYGEDRYRCSPLLRNLTR